MLHIQVYVFSIRKRTIIIEEQWKEQTDAIANQNKQLEVLTNIDDDYKDN